MTSPRRGWTAALAAGSVVFSAMLGGVAGPATATPVRSGSDARPQAACDRPADPQAVRCFALVRRSSLSGSSPRSASLAVDPPGYGPLALRDAYGLPSTAGAAGHVAVVVAFDAPKAERDLAAYRRHYGLPACTTANGCFTKLNQNGRAGHYPQPDRGWALEAALDLAMVSAACPACKITLVEAKYPTIDDIATAVDTAAASGATVVSNSYGAAEFKGVRRFATHYAVAGVTMVASSGDYGFGPASFPAVAPSVVAVGGTALRHASNARGWAEAAWAGAGSGCSAYFAKPTWQHDTSCHMRTVADISAVAAPQTGVAVFDSFGFYGHRGWFVLGGTSVSSPFVGGMIAAAGAGATLVTDDLYTRPRVRDVRHGANGFCYRNYLCTATVGYDGPTGLGTPRGLRTFTP